MLNAKKVLIICGTQTIWLTEVESGGVPLSTSLKQLFDTGHDTPVHIAYPGVGPVTLASFLANNSVNVRVRNWYTDRVNPAEFDIVGFSGTHLNYDDLYSIVIEVRRANPKATIIVGGPVTLTYSIDTLLVKIPEINYLV